MRLLELGHLKEDYLITLFFENKNSKVFLANGPITFINLREDIVANYVNAV